jgi:hypothetical protein
MEPALMKLVPPEHHELVWSMDDPLLLLSDGKWYRPSRALGCVYPANHPNQGMDVDVRGPDFKLHLVAVRDASGNKQLLQKEKNMADTSKEATELIAHLRERVKNLAETLSNFKKCIGAADWALSLERSHYAFEAAARHSIFSHVLGALTDKDSKATIKTITKYATREIRQLARPRHSSSPTANLIHGETLAAWVEVLEFVEMRS